MKTNQKGFTLIELLVVIAIIAILAAILFPVFARSREKARQTTCTSNQRQIAASLQMYAQDHEETLPAITSIWQDIKVDPGVLICPTKGKSTPNGYGYINDIAGVAIGTVADPASQYLLADSIASDNILSTWKQVDRRHSNSAIIAFMDGHVGIDKVSVPWQTANVSLLSGIVSPTSALVDGVAGWTRTGTYVDVTTDQGRTCLKLHGDSNGGHGAASAIRTLSDLSKPSPISLMVISGEIRIVGPNSSILSLLDTSNKKIVEFTRTYLNYASSAHWTTSTFCGQDITNQVAWKNTPADTGWLAFKIASDGTDTVCQIGGLVLTGKNMTGSNFQMPASLNFSVAANTNNCTYYYISNLKIGLFGGTMASILCPNGHAIQPGTGWKYCPICAAQIY
jgi:prepilin-type N-terminal cleavage/methylation domain-containing protein/prepilin-type processing-associated H-X9-DG protein